MNILTIGKNSEFRIRNSELLKNITKEVRIIFMTFKPIEELTFTDDFMFTTIMKDKEICKELLERLLKIKVSDIKYPVAQKSLAPFFETKGVRLDVYVDDGKRVFDIEIQTYIPEAIGKRMRYYQSILDMDSLQKGSVYTELKETYILFICTNDPFGRDLPVYTFKNRCIEDGDVSNDDKSTKVIYNATSYAKEKDSQIRRFCSIFVIEVLRMILQIK